MDGSGRGNEAVRGLSFCGFEVAEGAAGMDESRLGFRWGREAGEDPDKALM